MFLLRSWWARFTVLVILAGALLIPRTSLQRGSVWAVALAAVAATGIGLIRLSGRERADLRLVRQSGEIASPRDGQRIAVCGVIQAEAENLVSPVWKRPSVLYHFTVLHSESVSPGVGGGSKDVVDVAGYGAIPVHIEGPRLTVRLGGFPILYGFEDKYIDSPAARANVSESLRSMQFEELQKGEIEWVPLMDDMWDGRAPVIRNFRRGEGRPIEQCRFHEATVAPGDRVCAIGVWSAAQSALMAAADQELWLYRGSKETVQETLASSVGCGRVLGVLMIVGSVVAGVWVAGVL